ncbi:MULTISPECIES: TonB-dependent receptor [Acidobacterium]|uniref:Cna protein B-type domain protein n=1 Tax=Acidobacterium capsulatum (strain ATCC 51196 / DSM 11244 / BCRC 80197 / JCM 7670 / NBRC 15755 / NCIMB 13165 / 161) TaxID=240015 RepID=C1F5U3_ACIC5|nr:MULTISPECIES: TonB-dependent receptor [Acidobacterium]ACO33677.1 Cna protein B-type domain protein [Acidobacterium capsulatum ATCC 51196]HCT61103.1 hypothetical protein [Acidobacterium sp.]
MIRSLRRTLLLLVMASLAVGTAFAQENASITGTVTDPTGAVIPNATVILTNTATEHQQKSQANTDGIYIFGNLGVGSYSLSISAKGFTRTTIGGITVNAGQTVQENVSLKIGSTAQTITVQAGALELQTQTNELSTLMTGKQVSQLATNGRNVTALAALGLGVSNNLPAFSGVNALTSSNGISFNGTRTSHNIYLLDGGELNDRGCGGCFSSLPSIDALSEFRTLDSNYPPYYGLGSGGVVMMVIKSGQRRYHGELYEFNRNEAYDANNYFTNLAHQKRPEFRLNEPGGNIGGPLFIPHVYNTNKTRTFFFVNEEWRRLIQGSSPSIVNTIPSNDFPTLGQPLAYNIPAGGAVPIVPNTSDPAKLALYASDGLTPGQPFPNNVIPANLIDQNAVLELNAGTFPHPNYGNSQYISSIPLTDNVREDVVRIDHTINSKLQLMGHFLHDAVSETFYPPLWGDSTYPTVGTQMKNPSYSAVISLTQTISPNLLNVTAYDYSGNKITLDPVAGKGGSFTQPQGWSAQSFFPVSDNFGARLPEIDLQGSPLNANWSSSYFPWKNGYEGFEWRDDLTWNRGRHQLRFGFSWLHDYKNQQLQANTQGTAVFNSSNFSKDSYINFLLGDASSFTQLQYLYGKHWVSNNYSFYANDDWHVTRDLTLNLGLRYDAMPHTFERYNQFANFVPADYNYAAGYPLDPATGTLLSSSLTQYNGEPFYLNGIREAGVNGFPRGVVNNDFKTVEPRVGFAYDLHGDGRTVLRGGFGLFYERVQGNDVYNAALNPPFAYQPSATNVYFSNPKTSALTGQTTTQSFPSVLTGIKYHYPHPGTAEYSLGVQHSITNSMIAVIQYVGTDGWDQNDDRGINTLPLVDAANTASPYDQREGVANGSLNANLYRIFPGYSSISQEENETHFNYNALQMGLRADNWHNLTVVLAYTYSHEIDEVSADLNSVSNPFNLKYDKGSGSLDRRHILNLTYIYAFPFFLHSSNVAEREVLGGWEFSGITSAETGTPQPITYTGSDTLGLGGGTTNRPNLVTGYVHYMKHGLQWFDPASFSNPVAPWNGGTNQGFGDAGKDAVVLPGLLNFQWSLFKTFHFTQGGLPNLELRFEAFNVFNHTNFTGIDANSADSNFGQVTSAYDARELQFGAKFHF